MKKVAILIGPETDRPIIEKSKPYFDYFTINAEIHVLSAHRNPKEVAEFSEKAINILGNFSDSKYKDALVSIIEFNKNRNY